MKTEAASVPFFTSCRVALCLVGFFGAIVFFVIRSSFSMAVVCMTTPKYAVLSVEQVADVVNASGALLRDECGAPGWRRGADVVFETFSRRRCGVLQLPHQVKIEDAAFNWSRNTKSLVLSAVVYGYVSTIFVSGLLCRRFGPRRLMLVGTAVVMLGVLLNPLAAQVSPFALAAVQLVMGMAMGMYFPAMMTLWSRWAPPLERTTLVGLMMSGVPIGNIIAFAASGFLCDSVGWEALFYGPGAVGVLWVIACCFLVHNSPETHPRISDAELMYLQKNIVKVDSVLSVIPIPWRGLLTSPPLWAIAFSEVGFNYMNFMMLMELPQYLVDVMHTDISEDGLFSSLPHVCNFIVCFFAPLLADWMLRRGVKKVRVRKLMQSLSLFPAAGIMVGLGFLTGQDVSLVLACLGFYGITSTYRSGSLPNQIEIAPKYAGIVNGIVNTVACIPGTVAPFITTAFVKTGTREEWQLAFLVAGALSFVGGVVYVVFASADVQPWALDPEPAESGEANCEAKPLISDSVNNNSPKLTRSYGTVPEQV